MMSLIDEDRVDLAATFVSPTEEAAELSYPGHGGQQLRVQMDMRAAAF
jgi:hypothetical protein